MRKASFIAAVTGGISLAAVLAAAPAMAAAPPASVAGSVTVVSSLTLTVTSPATFNFGSLTAGATGHAPGAISYTVSTDDSRGFAVIEAATDFTASGNPSIPAADRSLMINGVRAGQAQAFTDSNAGVQTVTEIAATSGKTYSEDMTLAVPGATAPGTYVSTVTETAVAS
jgi:hypothetical protein